MDVLRLVAIGYLLGHWHSRDWVGGLAIFVLVVGTYTDIVHYFQDRSTRQDKIGST